VRVASDACTKGPKSDPKASSQRPTFTKNSLVGSMSPSWMLHRFRSANPCWPFLRSHSCRAPAIPKMSVEISREPRKLWSLDLPDDAEAGLTPPERHQHQGRLYQLSGQSTQCLHSAHLPNVSQSIAQTPAVTHAGTIKPNLRSRLFTSLCDGVLVDPVSHDSNKARIASAVPAFLLSETVATTSMCRWMWTMYLRPKDQSCAIGN
jgi:hypothetical protein